MPLPALLPFLLAVAGPQDPADPQDPPPGFRALFNGRDLDGWRGRPHQDPREERSMDPDPLRRQREEWSADVLRHWRVEEGELVNDGEGVFLTTEVEPRDFELWLEYRTVAGADSGVYLKAVPQVQIWDTTEAGGKWDLGAAKGSGGLWNNQVHERFPLVHADRPFGEWNRLCIRQIGARTSVWLNDRLVVDHVPMENYFDRALPLFPRGPIQLQTHGGEIRFRRIWLREIAPEEASAYLAARDASGFAPLFPGTGLEGWQGDLDGWAVEGSEVVCRGSGPLFTVEEYGDFQVRLEFLVPEGGNNGLAIRYPGTGDPAYAGMCELQVLDDEADAHRRLHPWQYHGSAYGLVAAHRGYLRPAGQWNFQEVTVRGGRVQVELNGTFILDADVGAAAALDDRAHPGQHRPRGHFGFAAHGSPVRFRNVVLRRLE